MGLTLKDILQLRKQKGRIIHGEHYLTNLIGLGLVYCLTLYYVQF